MFIRCPSPGSASPTQVRIRRSQQISWACSGYNAQSMARKADDLGDLYHFHSKQKLSQNWRKIKADNWFKQASVIIKRDIYFWYAAGKCIPFKPKKSEPTTWGFILMFLAIKWPKHNKLLTWPCGKLGAEQFVNVKDFCIIIFCRWSFLIG